MGAGWTVMSASHRELALDGGRRAQVPCKPQNVVQLVVFITFDGAHTASPACGAPRARRAPPPDHSLQLVLGEQEAVV